MVDFLLGGQHFDKVDVASVAAFEAGTKFVFADGTEHSREFYNAAGRMQIRDSAVLFHFLGCEELNQNEFMINLASSLSKRENKI